MEEKVLMDFESFAEFPNGILKVEKNSNLVYIKKDNDNFVARELIKSVDSDGLKATYLISYYDITNNKYILTLEFVKALDDKFSFVNLDSNYNIQIIPLSKILKLKTNSVSYLYLDDITQLVNFKEEDSKDKRKTYF